MNKKNISIIVFLIILSSLIYASKITFTTFDNGKPVGNIFMDEGSIYMNLSIPNYAYITKAEIDLQVVNNKTYEKLLNTQGGSGSTDIWNAQTFLVGNVSDNEMFDITYVTFRLLNRSGISDPSNVTFALTAVDASNKPSGQDLDNGTLNLSSLPSPPNTQDWVNISLNMIYYLNKSTNYSIMLRHRDVDGITSGTKNPIRIMPSPGDNVYLGGHGYWSDNDGATWSSTDDYSFIIHGVTNNTPENVTIKTNNEITYQNLSYFNGTVTDIDLNISSLRDCMKSCTYQIGNNCTCELNFTSFRTGTTGYSNLEVEYGIEMDNCSTYNASVLDIIFVDFDNVSINTTHEYTVDYSFSSVYGTITDNYSNSGIASNISLCLHSGHANVTADVFIEYINGSSLYNYYIDDLVLTNTTQTITLRITAGTTDVTATVYDQDNKLLEGTYIQFLKYDSDTNSYLLIGTGKTNFEGEAILPLVQDTERYRFMLYYPFETLRQTTLPTYITGTSIIFQIDLSEGIAEDFHRTMDIYSRMKFFNDTSEFQWTYSDSNSLITQACLYIDKMLPYGVNQSINASCLTTTSGTITRGAARENGTTFCARGMVTLSDEEWFIDSLCHTYESHDRLPAQYMGLLICFIMTIAFAFAFKYSVELGVIAIPLPLLFCSLMEIVDISTPVAVGIEIAAIVLAIILNKVID